MITKTLLFAQFVRQPNKLSVVLTRRRRRIASQPMHWDPTIRNPYRGLVVWSLPEILDVDVTLYRGPRSTKYEDKEWTIAIEDISSTGRPRRIATKSINISDFVDEQFGATSRHELFKLTMGITSKKVKEVYVTLALSTTFLKEGKATYVFNFAFTLEKGFDWLIFGKY